jgi:hypothetical protein
VYLPTVDIKTSPEELAAESIVPSIMEFALWRMKKSDYQQILSISSYQKMKKMEMKEV